MSSVRAEDSRLILDIRKLSKTFPGTRALDAVDFDLRPGEVHALVGQNGSGKSTLIKVLAGYHEADPGALITLDGTEVKLHDTSAARAAGLRFVHQDLGLVPALSTVENLALGRGYITRRGGRIDWKAERRDAETRIRAIGYSFDVSRPVSQLAAAERTGVAIARALDHWEEARILVVDEPTASLPRHEVRILFEALNRVREKGLGVVYVSHRLDEVFAIADRVSVLRDGRKVGTFPTSDLDDERLVRLIVGGVELRPPHDRIYTGRRADLLEIRGLRGTVIDTIDIAAKNGEVLGLAGLTGSGREEALPLIFGVASRGGEVRVAGAAVAADVSASIKAGMALVPANRHADGSITAMTVRENCALTDLKSLSARFLRINKAREREEVQKWIRTLDVRPPREDAVFATLSGGNQQKIVMAKWLRRKLKVLLLDEPTQGVDVGAKATIHALAREVAAAGAAVVIASSDDIELCDTCDRVLVFRDGRIVAEVDGERMHPEEITRLQLAAA